MTRISGYDELVEIGRGGLGDVYRATRTSTGGVVAIKVLRDVSDESVAWHRTRRELMALVALAGHNHVVQLLELLDLPEGPALVMEYAPGGSVAELLRRRESSLDLPEVVLIGRHTASALVAAHARGIVHRDVKPQNLLIDAYGRIRLCDFGVATLSRSAEFRTRTSALSMRYASPEDLDDELEISAASDVYSLGATLLHLARGAPPTLKDRLAPWRPPCGAPPELARLDDVLAACLHPDPARRPSASAVLELLDQAERELDDPRSALEVVIDDAGQAGPGPSPTAMAARRPPAIATTEAEQAIVEPDSDTTIRPDRVVRSGSDSIPSPAARTRDRRRWPLVAAVAGVAVAASIVVLAWTADEDPGPAATSRAVATSAAATTLAGPDDEGVLAIVERPDELTPIDDDSIVWPFGRPGDCLIQRSDDELATVGCAEPHDLQRYAVATLDDFGPEATYDADDVREAVASACELAFEPFVGVAAADSELRAAFTHPSADTWADGDRRYQCLVGVPGSRLVGDATGSGR